MKNVCKKHIYSIQAKYRIAKQNALSFKSWKIYFDGLVRKNVHEAGFLAVKWRIIFPRFF